VAHSVRQKILERIETALAAVRTSAGYYTNVKKVYTDIHDLEEIPKGNLPCLFVLSGEETRQRETIGAGAHNTRGTLTVLIGGVVFSATGAVDDAIENLLLDSNKVILNDATLGALIIDAIPGSVVRHNDAGQNFGSFDQVWRIIYLFNSSTGG
jgi:hypothetical protein